MLRLAYAMLTYLFVPVLIGHLYWRSINNPPYRQRIGERFGRAGQQTDKSSIWIHAVSVGEVQAAATLIQLSVFCAHTSNGYFPCLKM